MTTALDSHRRIRLGEVSPWLAYHGTDQTDFARFDVARAGMFNIGLHFGSRAAAESRIAFLREENPSAELRRLFQKLGYDGFVYANELEDGESAADSYCVFDVGQVAVVGEEMIKYKGRCAHCAA